jgi:hypothetical protein
VGGGGKRERILDAISLIPWSGVLLLLFDSQRRSRMVFDGRGWCESAWHARKTFTILLIHVPKLADVFKTPQPKSKKNQRRSRTNSPARPPTPSTSREVALLDHRRRGRPKPIGKRTQLQLTKINFNAPLQKDCCE